MEPFINYVGVFSILVTPPTLLTVPAGPFKQEKFLHTKLADYPLPLHLRMRTEFMKGSYVADYVYNHFNFW